MLIAKKFSLRPNKLVIYNEITHSHKTCNSYKELEIIENTEIIKKVESINKKKIIKKYHNFKISHNANKTMKEKINWLYYLSKNRFKQTYSNKNIYNYKLSFITLTLPSTQIHTTSFITKNIWNQFITELRTRAKMQNYVWRLEFQENRNVHYHLVTDSYLDYFFIQKIWNRIINKFGYVDAYMNKFNKLSLSEYNKMTNKFNKIDFEIIKKRYLKGKLQKWKMPNSVDVKSVVSQKAIGNYIAKYFSKNSTMENNCNSLDNEENSFSLRLWFCSRTLSKLKSITDYFENVSYNIQYVIECCSKFKYVFHRYCIVLYFDSSRINNKFSNFIQKLLYGYAKSIGYIPSS